MRLRVIALLVPLWSVALGLTKAFSVSSRRFVRRELVGEDGEDLHEWEFQKQVASQGVQRRQISLRDDLWGSFNSSRFDTGRQHILAKGSMFRKKGRDGFVIQ